MLFLKFSNTFKSKIGTHPFTVISVGSWTITWGSTGTRLSLRCKTDYNGACETIKAKKSFWWKMRDWWDDYDGKDRSRKISLVSGNCNSYLFCRFYVNSSARGRNDDNICARIIFPFDAVIHRKSLAHNSKKTLKNKTKKKIPKICKRL